MRENLSPQVILDAVSATGAGSAIRVNDFRHKVLLIGTSGMGTGDTITVKVQASDAENCPDFDSAASVSNPWEYVDCKGLEDTGDADGDTGISFADADDTRRYEINDNGAKWITINITAMSDTANTSVTAKVSLYND